MNVNSIDSDSSAALVLVGAPNSGKTTLYNWLTASHFTTVNYPGSTVEFNKGTLAARFGEPHFQIIDSPGTYSLFPKSEDEVVTQKLLFQSREKTNIVGVVIVMDGTQLPRQLILAEQIKEAGLPMILVLTMTDVLSKQQIILNKNILVEYFNCAVLGFDGLLGRGLDELVNQLRSMVPSDLSNLLTSVPIRDIPPSIWSSEKMEQKTIECEELAEKSLRHSRGAVDFQTQTAKLDRWLLHPLWGPLLFVLVMTLLFASVFWLATPLMDLIDSGFSYIAEEIVNLNKDSLLAQFVGNGLVASMGAVLVFVPQIFILFLGIGLLGDSGYLARGASLIDRPLSKLGLTGRSFVPLLSGFACAVPALMATRNISSKRDRWITNFIIPLLTCSARLPVYALLIGFLFYGESSLKAGFFLAFLYVLALLIAGVLAGLLNFLMPKKDPSFLVMELPLYRRPKFEGVLSQSLRRTKMYIKRAGFPIFTISTLIWVSSHFPNYQNSNVADRINTSYLGQAGKVIEPVLKPMGVDWRVGVGLLSAFAAREVFVSTLAIVFDVTADNVEDIQDTLIGQMKSAINSEGKKVFTIGSVLGLLVFFMVAMQCISTFAVSMRESGSLLFATSQLFLFNLIAYALAVGIFQLTTRIIGE